MSTALADSSTVPLVRSTSALLQRQWGWLRLPQGYHRPLLGFLHADESSPRAGCALWSGVCTVS